MRDPYVTLGRDGYHDLTGTIAMPGRQTAYDRSPGINLWRSKDLKDWEDMGLVMDYETVGGWLGAFSTHPNKPKVDLNSIPIDEKLRTLWAPELHYIESQKTDFIVASQTNGKGKWAFIMRSESGDAFAQLLRESLRT